MAQNVAQQFRGDNVAPRGLPAGDNLTTAQGLRDTTAAVPPRGLGATAVPPRGLGATAVPPRGMAATFGDNLASRVLGDSRVGGGLSSHSRPYRAAADDSYASRMLGSDSSYGGLLPQQNRPSYGDGSSFTARLLGGDSRAIVPQHGGRSYAASDENVLRNQIIETHDTDNRLFAVKPVLNIIEVIFHRASYAVQGTTPNEMSLLKVDPADEKALHAGLEDMLDLPTRVISSISCEIFCKSMSGGDVHNTTMDILRVVKHYNWDAKAVLALGSLAVSYGEFRLVTNLYSTNPLAKAVAILRQLPEILELSSGSLKPKLDALFTLVKAMVDVTKVLVDFYELQRNKFFTVEASETVKFLTLIPTAVYWVVRSTIICASQILGLTGMGHEYLSEAWELSSMAHKLSTIHSHLLDQLNGIYAYLQNIENEESFNMISSILETSHIDNSKPLRILFYAKDDQPALYDGHAKRRVGTEELRRKVVVLFITGLDIPQEDYTIIHQMYQEKRMYPMKNESQYEMVWVPIEENWTPAMLERFETLKDEMDWYSVHHPSVVSPVVARYIKHPQKWKFSKKPIFVVFDTQGKVVHKNAMHMMCIWGSVAYPFSEVKEKMLWEEETWRMDLIADSIDPRLTTWIQGGRYVCLFGGEEIEWIRRFTRAMKEAARESNITVELMYVGKSKPKERIVNEINAIIEAEKLAATIEWSYIWYFWLRIESMWYSKGQLLASRNVHVKNDPIMLGIISLLSFGSGTQGWALLSKGSVEITKGNADLSHQTAMDHRNWMPREEQIGFVPAFDEYINGLRQKARHHCTSLILPAVGAMPDTVSCAECSRLMERFTMFRCCTD